MSVGTPKIANKSYFRSILLILGAAALFGTTGTVLANGPQGVDPVNAGVVRLLVGGVGLAALSFRHFRSVLNQFWVAGFGAVGTEP